jgi:phage-related protein
MALRNLLVRVGADISGLRQGLKNAQKDVKFFGRNVTGSLKEMQGQMSRIGAIIGGGFLLKSGMQDAMRYEALMATLGESLGASRKDFEKWQVTVGRSLGFSQLQSAETASIMSLNFKKIATSQEDLTAKTTKMMEIAAVISNKRGMAMQEVSDRIRSAMNGEADGADELGVNVRISAMKQSEAYKQMADGRPWDQLSDQMQTTIRYHHILNEVSRNLGTTIQDTTASRMAQFTASLVDLRMALGQAFLPILYTVLPILTKLAGYLTTVIQIVGAFMRSLFGKGFEFKAPVTSNDVKTTQAQTSALDDMGDSAKKSGGAVKKAGKESEKAAKKAQEAWSGTFGFDEVNTIDDPKEDKGAGAGAGAGGGVGGGGGGIGGGGGLGGGIDMGTPNFKPFTEGLDKMAKMFDKYTKPIREVAKKVWKAITDFAKEQFDKISEWWNKNGDKIIKGAKNAWKLIKPIIKGLVDFIWDSIKLMVDGITDVFMGIVDFLAGVFTGDWELAWEGLKKIFKGALKTLLGFTNLTFIGGLKKALINFGLKGLKPILKFVKDFKKAFNGGYKDVIKYFKDMATNFKNKMNDMKTSVSTRVDSIKTKFSGLKTKVSNVAKDSVKALKNAWNGIGNWIGSHVVDPVVSRFKKIKDAFKGGLAEGLKAVLNGIRVKINDAIGAVNSVKNKIPGIKNVRDIPTIPRFAKGGITNGPTLAMVGDNVGGREVISPLDKLQGMLTTSVIQAMQYGGQKQSGDIILNIDGKTFARIVQPFLEKEKGRVGNNVRIRTT